MSINQNMGHELRLIESTPSEDESVENGLDNHVADIHSDSAGPSATFVSEPEERHFSSSHDLPPASAIPEAHSVNDANYAVASVQPAIVRSASTQSSQPLVFNTNRSMSVSANNTVDNGTLEYGPAGGYRDHMRPSATQHYRAGRYCAALKAFVSRQRIYISIVTSVLMFGMSVAGLWIGIAGSHQTLV